MKTIKLEFRHRLVLAGLVGSQRGNVAEMLACGRILEKIQISGTEGRLIDLKIDPTKEMYTWNPVADLSVLARSIELEDEEARRLKGLITDHNQWTISDAPWVDTVLRELDGVAPVLKLENSKRKTRN